MDYNRLATEWYYARRSLGKGINRVMSTNYGYDCTAAEHTECDPDYCDFAYEQMLRDDGSVQPFDDGLEQEYDYLVPKENLYED